MFAGKIFRNVGIFNGEDRPWSQWALKVRLTIESLTLASSGRWNAQGVLELRSTWQPLVKRSLKFG